MSDLISAKAAGRMLGLSARAVYDLAASGKLAVYRPSDGGDAVRFAPKDVEEYRESCRSVGTSATSAGASSSTAVLKAADTDLAAYFRAAGVRPKLTPTTARKAPGSQPLQLAYSEPTRS